jgi:hypothetical protein
MNDIVFYHNLYNKIQFILNDANKNLTENDIKNLSIRYNVDEKWIISVCRIVQNKLPDKYELFIKELDTINLTNTSVISSDYFYDALKDKLQLSIDSVKELINIYIIDKSIKIHFIERCVLNDAKTENEKKYIIPIKEDISEKILCMDDIESSNSEKDWGRRKKITLNFNERCLRSVFDSLYESIV